MDNEINKIFAVSDSSSLAVFYNGAAEQAAGTGERFLIKRESEILTQDKCVQAQLIYKHVVYYFVNNGIFKILLTIHGISL